MTKSKGVREISETLGRTFLQLVPLHPQQTSGRKHATPAEIKVTSEAALRRFYEAAQKERQDNRLGVISRARVALMLQQHLLKAGYPPPLVKQVLFAMLTTAFVGKSA